MSNNLLEQAQIISKKMSTIEIDGIAYMSNHYTTSQESIQETIDSLIDLVGDDGVIVSDNLFGDGKSIVGYCNYSSDMTIEYHFDNFEERNAKLMQYETDDRRIFFVATPFMFKLHDVSGNIVNSYAFFSRTACGLDKKEDTDENDNRKES